MSRVTNTFAAQALGGTRYFPYVAQSDALSYELNGAFVNHVRTTNAFDSYGNASEIVVTHLTEAGRRGMTDLYAWSVSSPQRRSRRKSYCQLPRIRKEFEPGPNGTYLTISA